MKFVETGFDGLFVIEPQVFGDERGFFMETFHAKRYRDAGIPTDFVQDNLSRSARGILRGLHFQKGCYGQGKLVRVTGGSVYDVTVDLRPNSKTFGKYFGIELSAENKKSVYIPPEFAHGFCVTSDFADFQYKCTSYYAPDQEGALIWNDPDIGIRWPVESPLLSKKDSVAPSFAAFKKSL